MTENLKVTVKLTKQLLDFALNITDEFKSRLIAEILSVNISKHLFFSSAAWSYRSQVSIAACIVWMAM